MSNPASAELLETLDLPFDSLVPAAGHMVAVGGPNGNELVDPRWCEEPTRVMSKEESQQLLALAMRGAEEEKAIHTRPTVRSMQAVNPVSSRPVPEVTVVDSQGRRVDP